MKTVLLREFFANPGLRNTFNLEILTVNLAAWVKMKKVYVKYLSDRILRKLIETDEKATLSKTPHYNSSVIRQKSESQNGCYKKTKLAKFSEKRTFLSPKKTNISYPLIHTCA